MDKQRLLKISYKTFREIFDNFSDYLKGTKYHNADVCWDNRIGMINVIVIRCNEVYITNDLKRNNDFLIICENKIDTVTTYVFNCTADPKYRRSKIANFMPQVYFANIRNHRQIPGRICLAQDLCKVWVKRFQGVKNWEDHGNFGINIHNSAGFFNSSLGCVILASEDDFIKEFRPLLKRCKYKSKIPAAVMQLEHFEVCAEAINGKDKKSVIPAKVGIR